MSSKEEDLSNESKDEMAQDRTEKADERTDWAEDRTLLAKERTFSAWGRTGLAAIAAGIGIARLLKSVESQWIATTVGILLILTGGMIFLLGFFSYRKALKKLEEQGVRGTSLWLIGLITLFLLLSTVFALILIFEE